MFISLWINHFGLNDDTRIKTLYVIFIIFVLDLTIKSEFFVGQSLNGVCVVGVDQGPRAGECGVQG